MAKIISYPQATPTKNDFLIGSQKSSSGTQINPTKNFKVEDILELANGFNCYVALINQTGTGDPTDIELKNDTTATMTWSRTSNGEYKVTASSGVFTVNKTIVFLNGGSAENNHDIAWNRLSDTEISVLTHNSDNKLTNASFEVRIYS